jgi:hypothetical protein
VTRLGIVASLLLVVAAAVAAFALTSAGSSQASSARGPRCPARVYAQGDRGPDRTVEAVIKAARRQIPVAYRRAWINQSGVVKLTSSTYHVTGVFAAWNGPVGGSGNRYLREAARACGRRIAEASWVVLFQVPEAQSAMYDTGTAFFAPTSPRRWLLWYPR